MKKPKSLIIVEGKNDRHFLQSLLQYIAVQDVVTESIVLEEIDWSVLGGSNTALLKTKFTQILTKWETDYAEVEKIGIILDADDEGEATQIALVNTVFKELFAIDSAIVESSTLIEYEISHKNKPRKVKVGFYCMNVAGKGELYTVLHTIKRLPSPYADCLQKWKDCYVEKEITETHKISNNDFDKFWVNVYLKYDTQKRNERDKNSTKLQERVNDIIFDFDSTHLQGLKDFLHTFR